MVAWCVKSRKRKEKCSEAGRRNTISVRKTRTSMTGGHSSSSVHTVAKKVGTTSLFASRFIPDVGTHGTENSLGKQPQLTSQTYASSICNTGDWPSGCLIDPFHSKLNRDKIYSSKGPLF
jgi:hypothetical protein